jgi:hypothetical protein
VYGARERREAIRQLAELRRRRAAAEAALEDAHAARKHAEEAFDVASDRFTAAEAALDAARDVRAQARTARYAARDSPQARRRLVLSGCAGCGGTRSLAIEQVLWPAAVSCSPAGCTRAAGRRTSIRDSGEAPARGDHDVTHPASTACAGTSFPRLCR